MLDFDSTPKYDTQNEFKNHTKHFKYIFLESYFSILLNIHIN